MSGAKSTEKKEVASSRVNEKSSSMTNPSPTVVLSGCNFTGCSINFTGGDVSQTKTDVSQSNSDVIEEKYYTEDIIEGLDLDIFETRFIFLASRLL